MTVILCMLCGAGIGLVVAVLLYVFGGGLELLNCAYQILSCSFQSGTVIPEMWSGDSFTHVCLFCVIGGTIIGLVYGIYKVKVAADEEAARKRAENSEEARQQRIKWANDVKQRALIVNRTCERNKASNESLVLTTYQASSEMKNITEELTKVAELKGKVDSIAEDLVKKGGIQ